MTSSNAHALTSRHGCVEDCDTGPGIGDKRRGESQSGEETRLTVIIRPRTQWSGQSFSNPCWLPLGDSHREFPRFCRQISNAGCFKFYSDCTQHICLQEWDSIVPNMKYHPEQMMVMIIWPRQIDTYRAIICSEASGFDYELGVSFVRCNHLSSKYQGPKRLTEM